MRRTAVSDHVAVLTAALDQMTAGNPAEAEALSGQLLARDPGDQAALLLLGLAIGAQDDAERARPLLVRVAHLRSYGRDPRFEMASALVRLRCRPLVGALYRECLLHSPDDAVLRCCAAEFLQESFALDAAREVLIEGIRRDPVWLAGHLLLGNVLADLGRFGAAIAQFRSVTTMAPEQPAGWANLGTMLKIEGRFDAALKAYDRAVALAPQNARIRLNRTVALLHAGRLRDAWPEFEWRLAVPEHRGVGFDRLMPPLSRIGDVSGRTILVTHEDGFGDTIQFMRYVPLLARRGARVIAWLPKPLVRIVESLSGVAEVLSGDVPLPSFDFQCPFVSLPRVFNTSLATIPSEVPYVSVDRELARQWAARPPGDGVRVGLVWAGQVRPHLPGFDVLDGRRSTELATLAPLGAVSGLRLVSLQTGSAADQARHPPPGLSLFDPMEAVTDFADTAAIIANLHVVVSVDTAVAHLAGAMGKPVLLLDRYDNCWRWLSGRTDSPWYPGLRIFRQKRLGEWGPVVERIAAALRALSAEHSAGRRHPSQVPECQDAA
jgi:tetratricopeptide (TPR) repeat protein